MKRSKRIILLAALGLIVLAGAAGAWQLRPEAREQRNWHRYHAAIKAGRYGQAVIALQNIIQVRPRSAEAYFELGQTFLAVHDLPRAGAAFTQATLFDSGLVDAQLQLARLQFLYGRFEQAHARTQLILKKDPTNRPARLLQAQSAIALGHSDEAIRTLRALLAEDMSSVEAHLVLGWALLNTKAIEPAAGEFRRAADLGPKDPRPYYGLGVADRAATRDAAAVADFEQALARDPNMAPPLLQIATIEWSRGEKRAAITRVEQQIQRAPQNSQFRSLLGFMYLMGGDVSGARQTWAKATEINPQLPLPYLLLGLSYEGNKLHDLAARKFEEALKADPGSAIAYLGLGYIRYAQGRHDQAKEYWEKAVALNPALTAALNNLAWYYVSDKGDLGAAQRYAGDALARAPHDPQFLDTRGWIAYKRGRYDEAVRYLSESLRALPNESAVHYHLGMAYLGAGRRDLARRELTAALTLTQDFVGAAEAKTALKTLQ